MALHHLLSAPTIITLRWRERSLKKQLTTLLVQQEDLRQKNMIAHLAAHGALALAWAKLEFILDEINELAFFNGAKGVIEKQVPRNLGRKLDFFRRSHRKLTWLAELAQDAQSMATAIETLSGDRHDLIHGIIENFGADEITKFIRHDYGTDGLIRREREFSPSDAEQLASAIVECLSRLQKHHAQMNCALIQDRLNYLKG